MAGIPIIVELDLKKRAPLDSRQYPADEAARLAIKWYFKGLLVRQKDTGLVYEYTGDETTNILADWTLRQLLYTAAGVPSTSLGAIGDVYIDETTGIFYKKTGVSTWTAKFTIGGSEIFVGTTDPPSNSEGVDNDTYYVNTAGLTKLYVKESGAWVFKSNIGGIKGEDGDKYATSSTTSVNLSTLTAPLNITVDTGLAWTVGQPFVMASLAVPADEVTGFILSYDAGTGAMSVGTLTISGTATHNDWQVNLSGTIGRQGNAFKHTSSDISLTQGLINSVIAGSFNTITPWSASVLNDLRSPTELTSTTNLVGSKAGHSIMWDGTRWYDNGIWRGSAGIKGDKGDTGNNGLNGVNATASIIPNFRASGTSGIGYVFGIDNGSTLPNFLSIYNLTFLNTANGNQVSLPILQGIGHNGIIVYITLSPFSKVNINPSGGNILLYHGIEYTTTLTVRGERVSSLLLVSSYDSVNGVGYFKVIGEDARNIGANTSAVIQSTAVDFTTFSLLTALDAAKEYAPVAVTLANTVFVRPFVRFSCMAYASSSNTDIVIRVIRSATSNFTTYQVMKAITYRLSTNSSCYSIDFIDNVAYDKVAYYYKLQVFLLNGTNYNISLNQDYTINLVPFNNE